jgi:hypothetical protein
MERKLDSYKSKKSELNELKFTPDVKSIDDVLKDSVSKLYKSKDYYDYIHERYNSTWIATNDLRILQIIFYFSSDYFKGTVYSIFLYISPFHADDDNALLFPTPLCVSIPLQYQIPFSEVRISILLSLYDQPLSFTCPDYNFVGKIIEENKRNKEYIRLAREQIKKEREEYIANAYFEI